MSNLFQEVENLLEHRDGSKRTTRGYQFRCVNPNHVDRNPSAHLDLDTGFYKCFACSEVGHISKLKEILKTSPDSFNEPTINDLNPSATNPLPDTLEGLISNPRKPEGVSSSSTIPHFPTCVDVYANRCNEVLNESKGLDGLNYWTRDRGLSKNTIEYWNLGFDPIVKRVTIPKYRASNSNTTNSNTEYSNSVKELVAIKLRDITNKELNKYLYASQGKDNSYYLSYLPDIEHKALIIFEGEINLLSHFELLNLSDELPVNAIAICGSTNLKSEELKSLYSQHSKVYLAKDDDEAGNKLESKLIELLGKDKLYTITFQDDLSEMLVKLGKEECLNKYKELISTAFFHKVEYVKNITLAKEKFLDYYSHKEEFIFRLSNEKLTELIGGIQFGGVSVITAKPGTGKSTFSSWIALEAISKGIPTFVGSFETFFPNSTLFTILSFNYGINLEASNLETSKAEELFDQLPNKELLSWSDYTEKVNQKELICILKECQEKGIKLIILDHLQIIVDETNLSDVSETMKLLRRFVTKFPDIAVLLNVQPKRKEEENTPLTERDLKGGSVIEDNSHLIVAIDKDINGVYLRSLKLRSSAVKLPLYSQVRFGFDKTKFTYTFG